MRSSGVSYSLYCSGNKAVMPLRLFAKQYSAKACAAVPSWAAALPSSPSFAGALKMLAGHSSQRSLAEGLSFACSFSLWVGTINFSCCWKTLNHDRFIFPAQQHERDHDGEQRCELTENSAAVADTLDRKNIIARIITYVKT